MATATSANGVIRVFTSVTPRAVAEVTGFTLNSPSDTTETSTLGSSWRTHKATLAGFNISIDCFYDSADIGQDLLRVGDRVRFAIFPNGEDQGDLVYSGTGIITSRNVTASVGEMITMTIEVQGTSSLNKGSVFVETSGKLLLESGYALLLETSPDPAGLPRYLLLEQQS